MRFVVGSAGPGEEIVRIRLRVIREIVSERRIHQFISRSKWATWVRAVTRVMIGPLVKAALTAIYLRASWALSYRRGISFPSTSVAFKYRRLGLMQEGLLRRNGCFGSFIRRGRFLCQSHEERRPKSSHDQNSPIEGESRRGGTVASK
jgi:hypothetical protein